VSVPNLTRENARVRTDLLAVENYTVDIDLTNGEGSPTDRTYRSRTQIRFSARTPGSSTFVDLIADSINEATLNGAPVDTSGYTPQDGLVLTDLQADNVLLVDAQCLYTNTGEGLHRFVDPIDKEVYLYSQFEAADAKRVYACFDQPDLKATFTFTVTAPRHWIVISNSAAAEVVEDGLSKLWRFETTPRMSPYITALVAGPYFEVRDDHDGIDLAICCRASLVEYLDTEALFEVTKQGFDWYHANFGTRYAFGKYHQIFVPEFNAGAMENAGAVTFRDDYVFRSKVTDARYERRAGTILHEMAHMWFGDLVTMRWWDDLWLNESFAEYASVLCLVAATRWSEGWTTFANIEKTWAYRQDQLPSTHPIASDAPDVRTAEVNFDGITYAKGASVLKQLGAYVGLDSFLAALRQYFVDHAYGNTTLADLLSALERESGRDLTDWSKQWLETSGINTLRPDFAVGADGRYERFAILQEAPIDAAHDNQPRTHRLAVGFYRTDEAGALVRTDRIELDVAGERTEVPAAVGLAAADFVLVNDDDLTYCKVRLDEGSLAHLASGGLGRLTESLPRALVWAAAWDMVRDAELGILDYLDLVRANIDAEHDIGIVSSIQRQIGNGLAAYATPSVAEAGWSRWAEKAEQALRAAPPGSDHQLAWAQAFLAAARTPEHAAVARRLLEADGGVPGLIVDTDLRWTTLQSLAAMGAVTDDEIAQELDRDPTAAGQRSAATARALMPTAEAKAEAWRLAVEDESLPNAMQEAVIAGFAHPLHGELIAPYRQTYFESVSEVWDRRATDLARNVVVGLFPSWVSTIDAETIRAADAFLAKPDVPPTLARLVTEGRADVARAVAARAKQGH
jgi:aminopeptidase N